MAKTLKLTKPIASWRRHVRSLGLMHMASRLARTDRHHSRVWTNGRLAFYTGR